MMVVEGPKLAEEVVQTMEVWVLMMKVLGVLVVPVKVALAVL